MGPTVTPGDTVCLSRMLSRVLSLAIVGASMIVKVPQILKIVNASSAQGLSNLTYIVELLIYSISIAYNWRSSYPLLTYGETVFLAVQDLVIVLLIFAYGNAGPSSRRPLAVLVFPALFAAFAYALQEPTYVLQEWLAKAMQASVPVLTASRLPQLYSNYANGSTGQLSAITVFMLLFGSLSRVFTTLTEVNDPVILAGFVAGAVVNVLLGAQVLYYWNAAPAPAAAKPKAKPASGTAPASGTTPKSARASSKRD